MNNCIKQLVPLTHRRGNNSSYSLCTLLVALCFKVSSAALCLNVFVSYESYEQRGESDRQSEMKGTRASRVTAVPAREDRDSNTHQASHSIVPALQDIISFSETSSLRVQCSFVPGCSKCLSKCLHPFNHSPE